MRIVFKLSQDKTRDLKQLKQFDICLLATRLQCPKCQILLEVPAGWWYPTTWRGLERLGVKISRSVHKRVAGDIVTEGTHVPIAPLDKLALPCEPQHHLQVPEAAVTFQEAIAWLEANRLNGNQLWLPIDPDNPHYWHSPPQTTQLPMLEWLQWAYWRKAQPKINPDSRTFTAWIRKTRVLPPSQTI